MVWISADYLIDGRPKADHDGGLSWLVPPHDTGHHALNFAVADDDRFKIWIGRLEPYRAVFLTKERLERGLALGQQCNDAFTVSCRLTFFDDDVVAIEDSFVPHRLAFYLEREHLSVPSFTGPEDLAEIELAVVLALLDRASGSDPADQGK